MAEKLENVNSSFDDDNDDDLDLCDTTESIWDKKLENIFRLAKSSNHNQSRISADGSVSEPNNKRNNKGVNSKTDSEKQLVSSLKVNDCDEDINKIRNNSEQDRTEIENKEDGNIIVISSPKVIDRSEEVLDSTNKCSPTIVISDSSDVDTDVQGSDMKENDGKTYIPIAGGRCKKKPVPRTLPDMPDTDMANTSNKDIISVCESGKPSSIGKSSDGVICTDDIDSHLEDYTESDDEKDSFSELIKSSNKKHNLNVGFQSSDDEIFTVNHGTSEGKFEEGSNTKNKNLTDNTIGSSTSDIDLSFKDVLLKKQRKSIEQRNKRKTSSSFVSRDENISDKNTSDSECDDNKSTIHSQDSVMSRTSTENPLLSRKQKSGVMTSDKYVISSVGKAAGEKNDTFVIKSTLKCSHSSEKLLHSIQVDSSISDAKKIKTEDDISVRDDTPLCSSEERIENKRKITTMPPKLVVASVSQVEIDKVLEIFPDADSSDIISRIKMIKTHSTENVLERVIDDMFSSPYTKEVQSPSVTSDSCSLGDEPDILEALGISVMKSKNESDSSASTSSLNNGAFGIQGESKLHGKLTKTALFSRKGKIPMKKIMNNPGTSMELENHDATSASTMDIANVEEILALPVMLTCESCNTSTTDDKIVQCANSHIICNNCVEKQVKNVLAPDSKEVFIKCCVDGCVGTVPSSQAKRVLPLLIMDLLEQRLDREALDSIKNMGDSLTCPLCGLPMTADPWLKEIECPSCKQKSCRFCKRRWNFADHTECSTYSALTQDGDVSSTLDVPFYWSPMPENENKDYITVVLDKHTPEFSHVKALFKRSMTNTKVSSIRRIQNLRLWQKFNLTKKHMVDDFGPDKLKEKQLFHGTNYNAVDAICREGLDWRMCGENAGTAYGQGTYFAKSASYSDRYATPFVPTSQNSGIQPLPPGGFTGFGPVFQPGQTLPASYNMSHYPGTTPGTLIPKGVLLANSKPTTTSNQSSSNFHFGTPGVFSVATNSNPLGFSTTQSPTNIGYTAALQTTTGSSTNSAPFGSSSTQSSGFGASNTQFTGFGSNSTQSGSGFTFGNPQNALSSGFTFGNSQNAPSSGFGFGVRQQKPSFSGFTFGTRQNSSTSGFSFGFKPSSSSAVFKNSTDFMKANMKYLFVARVLVGRSCVGTSRIRKPPVDPADSKSRPFNSCVDNVNSPHIFVIFDSSQCYPEYIIEYR